MQKNDSFLIGGKLLNDYELNNKTKIHLDCADIASDYSGIVKHTISQSMAKYLEQMSNTKDISYPTPNADLEKAFAENLKSILLKEFDFNNIETCESIFPHLEKFLYNLTSNGKQVKVYIPESVFGYFKYLAEKTGCEVELLKAGKDFKIDNSSFNSIKTPNDEQIQILLWLNPINPTQSLYTREEIKSFTEDVNTKFDIILEDLTFAELYNGKYPDNILNNGRKNFEYEDIDKKQDVQKPYFLCQEKDLTDKTIILYSIAKSLYGKDRLSMAYTPTALQKYVINSKSPNEKFDGSELVRKIVRDLMKNKVPIVNANIESYKEAHQNIVDECKMFNFKLQHLFGKNVEFIKPTLKEWQSANTLNIDVSNLYNFLKKNNLIQEKHGDKHADMYEFFIRNTGAKMISGAANNMNDGNVYFRLPLGGVKVKEKISALFRNLYAFIQSNKENIVSVETEKPFSLLNKDLLLTENKASNISSSEKDWYSNDDLSIKKYISQTERIKQSYENTFLSK